MTVATDKKAVATSHELDLQTLDYAISRVKSRIAIYSSRKTPSAQTELDKHLEMLSIAKAKRKKLLQQISELNKSASHDS